MPVYRLAGVQVQFYRSYILFSLPPLLTHIFSNFYRVMVKTHSPTHLRFLWCSSRLSHSTKPTVLMPSSYNFSPASSGYYSRSSCSCKSFSFSLQVSPKLHDLIFLTILLQVFHLANSSEHCSVLRRSSLVWYTAFRRRLAPHSRLSPANKTCIYSTALVKPAILLLDFSEC